MNDISDIKKMLLQLSDNELYELLSARLSDSKLTSPEPKVLGEKNRWFNEHLSGLDKDGVKRLEELERQLKNGWNRHVNERMVRYLRQLKNMKLKVPDFFRSSETEPKKIFSDLTSFCNANNIPQELVSRIVPSFVTYMEEGHMRPIIIVGERGVGKTTAMKMLIEEALKIPCEVVKIPQLDGSHGICGDCDTYQSADCGSIAKARISCNSLLLGLIFDEIDKVPHYTNRSNIDDELLSITDESNSNIQDNFLETTLVGLQFCPMFFTANDLSMVNPILVDRCTVIRFPSPDALRIKAICEKYVIRKLENRLYRDIVFDYDLMNKAIDTLADCGVTSIRKHQQMIESVLDKALNELFSIDGEGKVSTNADMFNESIKEVSGIDKHRIGFI